jgi:hypothetical protein
VKQLASDFGQISILLHNPRNRHLQVGALPNVDVHRIGFFVLREQDVHGGLVKGAQSDIKRLHDSFLPRQGWFALFQGLILVREEETEQIVPLPVSPRTVAKVRSFSALKWNNFLNYSITKKGCEKNYFDVKTPDGRR